MDRNRSMNRVSSAPAPDPGPRIPDDFDALLRRTMEVEPSPAFLPRVRERVAKEQPAWNWSWGMFAAAGATVVAILIAVSMPGTDNPPPPAVPQAPVIHATAPIPAAVKPAADSDIERAPAQRVARVARAQVSRPPTGDMPPVIVDERQRAALNAMVRMVAQGHLTNEAFAQTVPPSLQPIEEKVTGIAITPLVVSPIVVGGVLHVGPEEKQPPRPAEAGVSRP